MLLELFGILFGWVRLGVHLDKEKVFQISQRGQGITVRCGANRTRSGSRLERTAETLESLVKPMENQRLHKGAGRGGAG